MLVYHTVCKVIYHTVGRVVYHNACNLLWKAIARCCVDVENRNKLTSLVQGFAFFFFFFLIRVLLFLSVLFCSDCL